MLSCIAAGFAYYTVWTILLVSHTVRINVAAKEPGNSPSLTHQAPFTIGSHPESGPYEYHHSYLCLEYLR